MARWPANRDLVEVTVLTFLMQRPRHPYELHRFLLDTHKDFVTGLPRSLYHAVDRLADQDLIEPRETQREGARPERTVYQITDEGVAELTTRLRRMLEKPSTDMTVLSAGLSLMGCLPSQEIATSLGTRAAALEGVVASADATIASLRESGLPRLLLVELEYERSMRAAELAWLRDLLADIHAGRLTWPRSPDDTPENETPNTDPTT